MKRRWPKIAVLTLAMGGHGVAGGCQGPPAGRAAIDTGVGRTGSPGTTGPATGPSHPPEAGVLAWCPPRPADEVLDRFVSAAPPPDEIFSLRRYGVGWGGPDHTIEVEVRGESAELWWREDQADWKPRPDRYFRRTLTAAELAELREFVRNRGVDGLPSYRSGTADGWEYGYLHAVPGSAHGLTINNPSDDSGVYIELVRLFDRLADPDKLAVRYTVSDFPDGTELLYANADRPIRTVWAAGDDVRVLMGRRGYTGEGWRSFKDGMIGGPVDQPVDWRYGPEVDVKQLGDGDTRMVEPVATPDGRWFVGRVDDKLVRYNVKERRVAPVAKVELTEHGHALEFLPTHGKVLLARRLVGRWALFDSRYGLLDAASGQVSAVEQSGTDFRPFEVPHVRPFQPSARPDVVWVTLSNAPHSSYVGRYDLRRFRFRHWVPVVGLLVESDQVWIDESTARVYVAHDGHLFRFPLPKEIYEDWKE